METKKREMKNVTDGIQVRGRRERCPHEAHDVEQSHLMISLLKESALKSFAIAQRRRTELDVDDVELISHRDMAVRVQSVGPALLCTN